MFFSNYAVCVMLACTIGELDGTIIISLHKFIVHLQKHVIIR